MFRTFSELIKFGIVVFVLIAAFAGYVTSFAVESPFDLMHLLKFLGGVFFLSAGSLALNQVQEWPMDQKMKRTAKRPIASGRIKPMAAAILSVALILTGSQLLFEVSFVSAALGWLTIVLYNGLYTYWWKPKWVFGAVPGAIPGALPVTMGYAANSDQIFSSESVYLFLIMFLWQMPHFWALAIKYKDDYGQANVPTLPVAIGLERTIFHMGLYSFAYIAVAVLAPVFVRSSWVYLFVTLPLGFKIIQEFYRFQKSNGEKRWLAFFMWVNISMLIFLYVPVFDKWEFLLFN